MPSPHFGSVPETSPLQFVAHTWHDVAYGQLAPFAAPSSQPSVPFTMASPQYGAAWVLFSVLQSAEQRSHVWPEPEAYGQGVPLAEP